MLGRISWLPCPKLGSSWLPRDSRLRGSWLLLACACSGPPCLRSRTQRQSGHPSLC